MARWFKPAFAAILMLAGTAPARAEFVYKIVYAFSGASRDGAGETFTYISPDFLTGETLVPASELENCTGFVGCNTVRFRPVTGGLNIDFSEPDFGFTYVFPGAVLDQLGFWQNAPGTPPGALSIFRQAVEVPPPPPPVLPEPGAWVLMILGFGLTGYASRRRGRVTFA